VSTPADTAAPSEAGTAPADSAAPATASVSEVVRVERGHAGPEELAALTAVLLARAAAAGRPVTSLERPRSVAGWRRLERQSGFSAPHSWRS
jgi:hypothetical protein